MDSAPPRVSVVIPTHDRADLVERAIGSVLSQTLAPYEVIVVDDASTDETPEVLSRFADSIRTIRNDRAGERGAARNLGARAARGEFVAFLDSDDEWVPAKLRSQLPSMRALVPSVTGVTWIDGSGVSVGRPYVPPAKAWDLLPFRNFYLGGPSSLVLPRDLFDELDGFPEQLEVQGAEDWLFLMRLRARGDSLDVIPEPLVRYRRHSGNSTGDPQRVAESRWAALSWLEREGLLSGAVRARARAEAAATIARGFAWHGQLAVAADWGRTAARYSTWPRTLRSVYLIGVSAAWGACRRLTMAVRRLGSR